MHDLISTKIQILGLLKLAPKCLFSQVLHNDIEFYLRGGTEKSLNIKVYPPCFEEVFLEGSH